ncbi:GLD2 polymerase, partial [Chaetorhynchus papuensis]|nr:GLD2 polymerase [Chaetorhynchus papuensis]
MFPNSSNLGRPPFPPKYQQQSTFFAKLPVNIPPSLLSHQQIIVPPIHFRTAVGNIEATPAVTPVVTLQPMTYGSVSPVSTSDALTSFQGRKRQSQQSVPDDAKRQRIHSHDSDTTVVNQAVPLPEERRRSFPSPVSVRSPVLHAHGSPALIGCVPPLQVNLFPDPTETRLPVAKDEVIASVSVLCFCLLSRQNPQVLWKTSKISARVFDSPILVGYVLAPLFLYLNYNSSGFILQVLFHESIIVLHALCSNFWNVFPTENSIYIERPQLIRAKVPIVKFRDKVNVDFDLNVNNVIGIRNTFLLRTYAFIENRVRPLVLVVKKWASFREINDASRGTLNSYSLVLMVLHYLQTLPEPILPSLQKNYPECFDPTMQLHLVHQAPRTIPPYISKNGSSLGDLLIGFFKYYATEFDWSHQMISVREAKAIARPDGIEWRNKFICVEEPFDGTNTARAVHEKQKFDMIRVEFAQAWRLLRDKKDLNCILPLKAAKQKR